MFKMYSCWFIPTKRSGNYTSPLSTFHFAHRVYMDGSWLLEWTAVTSLYNIKQLVFVI
jgi:hypothetical protein